MPALSNPRHELFAQELAKGKTATEAYQTAGFKPNRHNGAALARQQHIVTRTGEIQSSEAEIARKATQLAAERLSIGREWVMARLVENANRAMQAEAVVRDGMPSGEYKYDGSVANRALELLGKEIGMFVDRSKVDLTAKMSVEQWLDSLPED